jgi:predicted RNA binding protein YcfA (HicA-like mRNA interferase family)
LQPSTFVTIQFVSKVDKLRNRIAEIPSDFTWDEMVAVLKGLGFEEKSRKGGSYRTFISATGKKLFMHKPHPGSIVKLYCVRQVVEALREDGILEVGE